MADETTDETPKRVVFHYIKSTQFRVIHGDGVIGGITPSGLIHFAVYNERPAIPQMVVQRVEAGRLGEEEQKVGREGIVRELEADVIVSLQLAKGIRDWLSRQIADLERKLPAGPAS
jgi:hypothetical protein